MRLVAGWALAASFASGCAVFEHSERIRDAAHRRAIENRQAQQQFGAAMTDAEARRRAQEVARPWLAGRPQPLARELTLPAALRRDVDTTLLFPDRQVVLPMLAERITLATGIPVRVQPDALLPQERFAPRLDETGAPPQDAVPAPWTYTLPQGAQPLPRLLDMVAARLGVAWRYADGELEIFRTRSQVFNVRALLARASARASLGRTANATQGAFESASGTELALAGEDLLGAIAHRIEPLLTQAGRLAAQADGSSLVVVTDTPAALLRVGALLERENRTLMRRVRLVFEEVSVVLRDDAEAGIDWNLVYAAARAGGAVGAPALLADAAAGSLAGQLEGGPWAGSSAIVRALSELGVVTRHTSVPLLTLNRQPVTHAVRTTFSWIDEVKTTALSTVGDGGAVGALPSVSVSQKAETVGQFLTLIPDAQDDGQVLLSIAYDSTVAQPLRSVNFGSGDNAVQIQQLTVDGSGTVQQVALRPGQPLIVSGFERHAEQSNGRRLDRDAPWLLGGSQRSSTTRETTVVILTAFAEEGA
ncbi:lipoprotein [Verticiella sediminum]